jgi:hypothetical protein
MQQRPGNRIQSKVDPEPALNEDVALTNEQLSGVLENPTRPQHESARVLCRPTSRSRCAQAVRHSCSEVACTRESRGAARSAAV